MGLGDREAVIRATHAAVATVRKKATRIPRPMLNITNSPVRRAMSTLSNFMMISPILLWYGWICYDLLLIYYGLLLTTKGPACVAVILTAHTGVMPANPGQSVTLDLAGILAGNGCLLCLDCVHNPVVSRFVVICDGLLRFAMVLTDLAPHTLLCAGKDQ